jgi:hypothetical protein
MEKAMSKKLQKVHEDAIREFDRVQSALYAERKQCLEDRRFYSISGAQWEGDIGDQFENKPQLEVNKVHLALIKIFNEYRNNRISVDFVTKDGSTNDDLANACDGLFRADEKDSCAEEAYDNAFEEAVGGGFGALRLITEYEDEEDDENEKQRIRIEPIYDADSSVFYDLDAKRQDKSDAKMCLVIHSMTPEDYREEFGKEPQTYRKMIQDVEFDWYTPDLVYIAELYMVESAKETVHTYQMITGDEEKFSDGDFEADEGLLHRLTSSGAKKIGERKVTRRRIHKYIMDGNEILEDVGIIAGKHIPIIPAYGKRWFVDSVERCMGHVRLVKDVQRLKNMLTSKLAEITALSPIEKPIFIPEQVAGHEAMWADDNVKNYPYLLVNELTDAAGNPQPAGPVAMTSPPQVPPALATLIQLSDADMKELLGNSAEGEKMLSHVSGKAHEMVQKRIDGQAFIYMDNFAKTIKRVGEVWLSMAKDVYVEKGRPMKTIDPMGQIGQVKLQQPGVNEEGKVVDKNDLTEASFDVDVSVGPSSSSQREATVQTLIGMLSTTQDGQTRQVLEAMIMLNMEGDGVGETREYFRRQLVQMGVLPPTPEEAEAMKEPKEPSAQDQALLAMAAEANAKAQKVQAEIQKIISDVELNAAKTAETYSSVDMANLQRVKDTLEAQQQELMVEQQRIMNAQAKMQLTGKLYSAGLAPTQPGLSPR